MLAATICPGKGDMDLLLERFADSLLARGIAVRGLVQTNSARKDGLPCDMDVRVLPEGPTLRISQTLGTGARGCRLDSGALEEAVARVGASLSGAQLLIVNKFGKRESEGGGFRPVIAEALAQGIPVLCGTNELNRPAFDSFASGMASDLPPSIEAFEAWFAGQST
ncbi:MAG: 3-dehydroquinate dehydratase [Rhodobacterales bacterium]|nr:MAG: 3-dehydroquinate dehydratase [Rhodobacterales bacterium]